MRINKTLNVFITILLFMPFLKPKADELNISVHVYVLQKPCVITNQASINVSFDEYILTTHESVNAQKASIPIRFSCNAENQRGTLTIIPHSLSNFDSNAIASNIDGLGIRIKYNQNLIELNKPYPLDFSVNPVLEATLVTHARTNLIPGDFTGNAVFRFAVD